MKHAPLIGRLLALALTMTAGSAAATTGDRMFEAQQHGIANICEKSANPAECAAAVNVLLVGTANQITTATLCELGEPANAAEARKCEAAKQYRDRLDAAGHQAAAELGMSSH
ncbi:hypothetical protein ACLB5K_004707 [Enterobacter hormaechei]|uniref:Uncharacterized protein n=1 Tax=Enterobacter hormaechei TaxID=158836 RepID=A0ABD4K4J9_9ENTR|nr:hypothetical protein [Enterobacter hormaechei]CAF9476140.1 hypothetical protein AI2905V1_4756 [Enterobacter cloacae]HBM2852092.1 hypothetical protein [Enterobacter hormaechei subsp. xiangfangensis]HBX0504844.1 hypothetical protein [Klebsiella pneumoniae]EKV8271641.1 hypothetical protein [Enterobacter hormaechei]EKV9066891.1 hypothetical protein [Enterobacter hormaechei]